MAPTKPSEIVDAPELPDVRNDPVPEEPAEPAAPATEVPVEETP